MSNLTPDSDNLALINLSLSSDDHTFLRQAACDNAEWAADLLGQATGADPVGTAELLAQAHVRATLALALATLAVTPPTEA